MSLSISASEQSAAESAATEIEQIMTSGAVVGVTPAIAATSGFQSTASVQNFFKAAAAGIIRHVSDIAVDPKVVYVAASLTGAQSITGGNVYNTVNFSAIQKDTVNGVNNLGNWVYRCQSGYAGLYHVSALVTVSSPTSGDSVEFSLWKVAPSVDTDTLEGNLNAVRTPPAGGALGSVLPGNAYIELAEGEGIRLKVRTTNAGTQNISGVAGEAWLRIHRVAGTPT